MKLAYKMFHIHGNETREHNYEKVKEIFSDFDQLETPTIRISDQDSLLKFVIDNPKFKFDPSGYSLHGEQGWRYGELGIWASNWTAWNKFSQSDYDYLVLMEDDLLCNYDLPETIIKYINECPDNFDALYIFSPKDQHYKYHEPQSVSENLSYAYQDWSCACYVIQKKTINYMIEVANKGFDLPLDWFMFRQQNIFNVFSTKPNVYTACTTEKIESTFQTTQKREIINGIF